MISTPCRQTGPQAPDRAVPAAVEAIQQLAVGAQSADAATESLAELRQLSAKLDALRTAQAAAEQAAAQRAEQLLAASAAQTAVLAQLLAAAEAGNATQTQLLRETKEGYLIDRLLAAQYAVFQPQKSYVLEGALESSYVSLAAAVAARVISDRLRGLDTFLPSGVTEAQHPRGRDFAATYVPADAEFQRELVDYLHGVTARKPMIVERDGKPVLTWL
jgi:hypothetical protein